jgi:signal transduction histidine kinase
MNCQAVFVRLFLALAFLASSFFACDGALSAPVTKLGNQANLAPTVQLLEAVGESESAAALFSRWNTLSGSTRSNGLSEGFSRHVIWARLTLDRPMSVSENWWLVLSNPLLDHVDVYLQRSDGSVSLLSTGEEIHVSDAAAPTLLPTVPLRLEPGENRILIRLQARNAIATRIAIRNDRAMLWFEHLQLFQGGLIAGTHLFAALAGFVVALAIRDKVWVLFSVFVLVSGLSLLSLLGLPGWMGLRSIPGVTDKLHGVMLVVSMAAVCDFVVRLAGPELRARQLFRWGVGLGWLICIPASLSILAGYFSETILKFQFVILAVAPVVLAALWRQWRQGVEAAGYFLAGVGAYACMSLVRVLRNLGVLPSAWWTEGLHEMMSIAYLSVLAFGIATRSAKALAQRESLEAELAGERAARQSERDFLAMLSHELRTPLATIEASARLLRDVPSLDSAAREVRHGKIERSVGRLRELFDRMLASERVRTDWEPINVRDIDLVSLAGQVRDLAISDRPGSIVQVVPPLAGKALVKADGSLLRVALENLVGNALTYGPLGEAIQIEIRAVERGWRVGVIDSGPPIPETEAAALFLPYVRGPRAVVGPGAGLGLFIVRRIARTHGGDAGLDHPGAQGNRFWIELPSVAA